MGTAATGGDLSAGVAKLFTFRVSACRGEVVTLPECPARIYGVWGPGDAASASNYDFYLEPGDVAMSAMQRAVKDVSLFCASPCTRGTHFEVRDIT
jgi:hypothetical protein